MRKKMFYFSLALMLLPLSFIFIACGNEPDVDGLKFTDNAISSDYYDNNGSPSAKISLSLEKLVEDVSVTNIQVFLKNTTTPVINYSQTDLLNKHFSNNLDITENILNNHEYTVKVTYSQNGKEKNIEASTITPAYALPHVEAAQYKITENLVNHAVRSFDIAVNSGDVYSFTPVVKVSLSSAPQNFVMEYDFSSSENCFSHDISSGNNIRQANYVAIENIFPLLSDSVSANLTVFIKTNLNDGNGDIISPIGTLNPIEHSNRFALGENYNFTVDIANNNENVIITENQENFFNGFISKVILRKYDGTTINTLHTISENSLSSSTYDNAWLSAIKEQLADKQKIINYIPVDSYFTTTSPLSIPIDTSSLLGKYFVDVEYKLLDKIYSANQFEGKIASEQFTIGGQLAAPCVTIKPNGEVSWFSEYADSYIIQINNNDPIELTELVYGDYLSSGYKIKVKAKSENPLFTESDWSEEKTYVQTQLATPTNITVQSGTMLTWNSVEHANIYEIRFYFGTTLVSTQSSSENYWDLWLMPSGLNSNVQYEIKIVAKDNNNIYSNSNESEPFLYAYI